MTGDVLPELIVVKPQEQSLGLAPVGTLVPTLNPSHKNTGCDEISKGWEVCDGWR